MEGKNPSNWTKRGNSLDPLVQEPSGSGVHPAQRLQDLPFLDSAVGEIPESGTEKRNSAAPTKRDGFEERLSHKEGARFFVDFPSSAITYPAHSLFKCPSEPQRHDEQYEQGGAS